jgi:hypothetical protein
MNKLAVKGATTYLITMEKDLLAKSQSDNHHHGR